MPLSHFITELLSFGHGKKEYAEKLKLFLSDKKLSKLEEKALEGIAKEYGLEPNDMKKLQATAIGDMYLSMAEDQRITEEERKALDELVQHFGVSLEETSFNQKQFLKYYTLALIENGLLPEFTKRERKLPMVFRDGEILHWVCPATLRRFVAADKDDYKFGKDEPYEVGAGKSGSTLKTEDRGSLYFTNERIGFLGRSKQFAMGYGSIQAATVGRGGLSIFKKARAAPYVIAMDDYDVPCSILSFIVNER